MTCFSRFTSSQPLFEFSSLTYSPYQTGDCGKIVFSTPVPLQPQAELGFSGRDTYSCHINYHGEGRQQASKGVSSPKHHPLSNLSPVRFHRKAWAGTQAYNCFFKSPAIANKLYDASRRHRKGV